MKVFRLLVIFTTAIALSFIISPSFAQEKKEQTKPAAAEKTEPAKAEKADPLKTQNPDVPLARGKVVFLDAAKNTLVIKNKKGLETQITANAETKIVKAKKTITLQDIKIGDKAKVKYSEVEGKKVASLIRIFLPKAEKTNPKTEAAKEPAKEEPAKAEPAKK